MLFVNYTSIRKGYNKKKKKREGGREGQRKGKERKGKGKGKARQGNLLIFAGKRKRFLVIRYSLKPQIFLFLFLKAPSHNS